MARKKADQDGMTFEEALSELEAIVKQMEEGDLTLDETLAKFERGIALSRMCSKKLEQAEKRIDMVLCSGEGEIVLKPAGIAGESDE